MYVKASGQGKRRQSEVPVRRVLGLIANVSYLSGGNHDHPNSLGNEQEIVSLSAIGLPESANAMEIVKGDGAFFAALVCFVKPMIRREPVQIFR